MLSARTTVYTITSKRLVMRVGMALPVTINLPFNQIDGASLRLFANGSGDIPLKVTAKERVAYLLLWPHARPFHFAPSAALPALHRQCRRRGEPACRGTRRHGNGPAAGRSGAAAPPATATSRWQPEEPWQAASTQPAAAFRRFPWRWASAW